MQLWLCMAEDVSTPSACDLKQRGMNFIEYSLGTMTSHLVINRPRFLLDLWGLLPGVEPRLVTVRFPWTERLVSPLKTSAA